MDGETHLSQEMPRVNLGRAAEVPNSVGIPTFFHGHGAPQASQAVEITQNALWVRLLLSQTSEREVPHVAIWTLPPLPNRNS